MIYLNNNDSTPIAGEVVEAMERCQRDEPNADQAAGAGRKIVEAARETIAGLIGAAKPSEIQFTAGREQSIQKAIRLGIASATQACSIVTTQVEHDPVTDVCTELESEGGQITKVGVTEDGLLIPHELEAAVRQASLVSITMANDETGVIFPVGKFAEMTKSYSRALFHSDGTQAAGKIPIQLKDTKIDLFSISAHTLHGPEGVGALYVRDGVSLSDGSLIQASVVQPSDAVPLHLIAGFRVAAELAMDLSPMQAIEQWRDRLEAEIIENIPDTFVNGSTANGIRLPNTSNISFENTNGEMIAALLETMGVSVSTGSACGSVDHKPSATLQAMNVPYRRAMGSIRFSFGRMNCDDDVIEALVKIMSAVSSVREITG